MTMQDNTITSFSVFISVYLHGCTLIEYLLVLGIFQYGKGMPLLKRYADNHLLNCQKLKKINVFFLELLDTPCRQNVSTSRDQWRMLKIHLPFFGDRFV